jgi:ABC-type antimicrobial peptide transport system permease subunit
VVGIVGDVHQEALRADVRSEYYMPFAQMPPANLIPFMAPKDLAIRTTGDPLGLVGAVRQAIWSVDSQQPIAQVRVMADYLDEDLAPDRMQAQLTGTFAGLALLLASLGVYGVLSYTMAQRRREMSLRMALGAQPRALVRWVVFRGLQPVLAGLALGLAAAYALAQAIARVLYGVQPRDPLTFGTAGIVLLAVATVACVLPALRAARVDPAVALRSE